MDVVTSEPRAGAVVAFWKIVLEPGELNNNQYLVYVKTNIIEDIFLS